MSKRDLSPGCLALFALPFAGIGVGFGIALSITISRGMATTRWVERPATVLEADLETSRGDDSTTYRATARYVYEYLDRLHTGTAVSVHSGSDNIGSFHQDMFRTLDAARQANRSVPCYVNPTDPARAVLYRGLRMGMVLFQLLFAVVFGGVGIGMLAGIGLARRNLRREAELQAAHPGEPWKWRPEWHGGVIPGATGREALGIGLFAGFWNLISMPAAAAVLFGTSHESPAVWFVLLFPLIGVFLLWWAAVLFARWRRYRGIVFHMAAVPGVLGGKLAGVIRIPDRLDPPDGFQVTLRCTRRVTSGSGRNRHTSESVLWEEGLTVRRGEGGGLSETLIPVLFAVPADQPASAAPGDTENRKIAWKLAVSAIVPGADLKTSFTVPVFPAPGNAPP